MAFYCLGNFYLSVSVSLSSKTIRLKIHNWFAWLWSWQLSSIHASVLCEAQALQQNVFIFTQWCSKIREDFSHSSGGPQSLSLWPLSDLSLWCPLEAEKHDLCVGASLFVSCLSIPTRKVRAERFKGMSTVMGSTDEGLKDNLMLDPYQSICCKSHKWILWNLVRRHQF